MLGGPCPLASEESQVGCEHEMEAPEGGSQPASGWVLQSWGKVWAQAPLLGLLQHCTWDQWDSQVGSMLSLPLLGARQPLLSRIGAWWLTAFQGSRTASVLSHPSLRGCTERGCVWCGSHVGACWWLFVPRKRVALPVLFGTDCRGGG